MLVKSESSAIDGRHGLDLYDPIGEMFPINRGQTGAGVRKTLGRSNPVKGVFGRAELARHVRTLPDRPDLVANRTGYCTDDWGFCLPYRLWQSMTDESYRVDVDSELSPETMTCGSSSFQVRREAARPALDSSRSAWSPVICDKLARTQWLDLSRPMSNVTTCTLSQS